VNLQFVARETADRLANQVSANMDVYLGCRTADLIAASDTRLSRIDAPNPPFLLDDNGECRSDADCTKEVYQWLSGLTPVQAADARLWIYLTHTTFSEYMQKRWGTGLARAENTEDVIVDRWFFK
jgi:hypothetical protein